MTNYRKQLTAKAAWARMAAENRTLRESLEAIAEIAGRSNGASKREDALRSIRHLANAALGRPEKRAA